MLLGLFAGTLALGVGVTFRSSDGTLYRGALYLRIVLAPFFPCLLWAFVWSIRCGPWSFYGYFLCLENKSRGAAVDIDRSASLHFS